MPIQVQAGQFAFYFRYPGPDGKFGPLHPEKISETNQNIFGLDADHDPDSKDDIVTAEMAIPVNREVRLLMHAKDVGHSFYVPALADSSGFRARDWIFSFISRQRKSASMKLCAASSAAWATTT